MNDNATPTPPTIWPYHAELESWTARSIDETNDMADWPNSVAVEVISNWDGTPLDTDADTDKGYADVGAARELVQIDTNYKSTRTSDYPVLLTRTKALELVVQLLEATEDTFHYARVGRLRASEAAELLEALGKVDAAVLNLREHALIDLMVATGIE